MSTATLDLAVAEARIRAYLDDSECGQYVFHPGMGCLMCDFRDDYCLQWGG